MTEFSLIPEMRVGCLARQSSDKQVRHNKESQSLQYGLAERTNALSRREVNVIRVDLGAGTDIRSTCREGLDCVRSSVASEDIVISWKASRLSCRDKEWRPRFDICQLLGTILRDESLVLGIKGTLSAVARRIVRQQFHVRQVAEARRSELFKKVRTFGDAAGKSASHSQRRVCEVFRLGKLGVVRQPCRWFRRHDVELPTKTIRETRLGRKGLPQSLILKRRKASMSSTPLPTALLDAKGKTHDNLPQTVFDACNGGGDRVATTTSEPNPNGRVARSDRPKGSSRTGRSHGPHSGGGFSSGRRRTQ